MNLDYEDGMNVYMIAPTVAGIPLNALTDMLGDQLTDMLNDILTEAG